MPDTLITLRRLAAGDDKSPAALEAMLAAEAKEKAALKKLEAVRKELDEMKQQLGHCELLLSLSRGSALFAAMSFPCFLRVGVALRP